MTTRPFRFGVVSARARSGADWAEQARRLEGAGFNTLLMPDRLNGVLAPLPALSAAAAVTTNLRIGTYVLVGGRHNAAQIAHDTATLDFLSGGRFELGLGTGVSEDDFRRAGLPFGTAGERLTQLAGTIAAVQGFWREFASGDPRHYPVPQQRPGPPIMLGGNGKRLLSLAARQADGVSIGGSKGTLGPDTFAERIAWVREEAGTRFSSLEISINVAAVVGAHPPADHVRGRVRAFLGAEIEALVREESPFVLAGSTDAICDRLLALRERFGLSYILTADDQARALAPVVERLAGR
ncbi:MAG TPA: TIGR03621 family F420-dependent LLM class oxidoreductase [Thermomicrobiales bacterium]